MSSPVLLLRWSKKIIPNFISISDRTYDDVWFLLCLLLLLIYLLKSLERGEGNDDSLCLDFDRNNRYDISALQDVFSNNKQKLQDECINVKERNKNILIYLYILRK